MKETFKDIIDYEWYYQVSNLGRIKSLSRYRWNWNWWYYTKEKMLLSYSKERKDYERIWLSMNNISKTFYIHRLVAENFIPVNNNNLEVNHKNWIKTDNRLENLEWCTKTYNAKHSYRELWRVNWMQWNTSKYRKKVFQYQKWKLIKEWSNIQLVERTLQITHVWDCCQGKRKTAWGYNWQFVK